MANVPCIKPWSSLFGRTLDFSTDGQVLLQLASSGRLAACHIAPPYETLRVNHYPPLRSALFPWGLPTLEALEHRDVLHENSCVAFAANLCCRLYFANSYFSLFNLSDSWLWVLSLVAELLQFSGVAIAEFSLRDEFGLEPIRLAIAHNTPSLHELSTIQCLGLPGLPLSRLAQCQQGRGRDVSHAEMVLLGERAGELWKEACAGRLVALAQGEVIPLASTPRGVFPGSLPAFVALHGIAIGADPPDPALVTDIVSPFVHKGLGAPKGLSVMEQVALALGIDHPWRQWSRMALDADLIEAIEFELSHSPEEIDRYRTEVADWLTKAAQDLEEQRRIWCDSGPPQTHKLRSKLHGPLMQLLSDRIEYEDPNLVEACRVGFPFFGELPPLAVSSKPCVPCVPKYSPDELRASRTAHNDFVLSKLRELPYNEDIYPKTVEDSELGAMTPPGPLWPSMMHDRNFTRRIPVREQRAGKWRTRIVDHETESFVNPATQVCEAPRHDTLDVLCGIILMFLHAGVSPLMWKRDVSKAFRRVPIFHEHLDCTWTVWLALGQLFCAQHLGMCFGTISAGQAWHRVGGFLRTVLVRLFKVPVGRYVDDFFGASRPGLSKTGGWVLSLLAGCLGFPCDPSKDDDNTATMSVLGALVAVDDSAGAVTTRVSPDKAELWAADLWEVESLQMCSPGLAAKLAGRLSFAVTTAADRCGRAYVKVWHAQSHDPYRGNRASTRLLMAASWWRAYSASNFVGIRSVSEHNRVHIRTWQDAAGLSRKIAAVAYTPSGWFWTEYVVEDVIWNQLSPRKDHQIGFQELLGVLLSLGTFESLIAGSLWTAFVDNDGVMFSLSHGGGGNPETNIAIGKVWLAFASLRICFYCARVESKANLADGPSRDHLAYIRQLKARYVVPRLPAWVYELWRHPDPL